MNKILKNPRITEKATVLAEGNVYTFNVDTNTTKNEIIKSVKALYKVTPVQVRTVTIPTKKVTPKTRNQKIGTKGGGKKAYVYLKKGDKIEVL